MSENVERRLETDICIHTISYRAVQTVHKAVSDQNRVCCDSKAQGYTLKRVGLYPPYPVLRTATSVWNFP